MTILVTGGAGYIGSHTVHELVDAGENVLVVDDLSTGFRSALPPAAELTIGNVGDPAAMELLLRQHQIESIIHFAGSIVVPESVVDPLKYYSNNTVTSRALIELAVKHGVRHFVFSSTAAVYGDQDSATLDEEAAKVPLSPYGWSKLMTEIMLRDVGRAHGLKHTILRYFNVAGADPEMRTGQSSPTATHLIKIAAQTVAGLRPSMSVFGTDYPTPDGTCVRDYIHVTDLARAHVSAIRYLRSGGESDTFNCGYGRGSSVFEVIEAARRVSGFNLDVRHEGRRAGDAASLVANVSHIRRSLDWRPSFDHLDTIVSHAIAWEKKLASVQ